MKKALILILIMVIAMFTMSAISTASPHTQELPGIVTALNQSIILNKTFIIKQEQGNRAGLRINKTTSAADALHFKQLVSAPNLIKHPARDTNTFKKSISQPMAINLTNRCFSKNKFVSDNTWNLNIFRKTSDRPAAV